MKIVTLRAVSLTLLVGIICLGIASAARQAAGNVPVIPPYPNTAAGLEQLMSDMIALQKKGDNKMLAPYLQSLVLPDAEHWFVAEFGDTTAKNRIQVQMTVWGRALHLGTKVSQLLFRHRSRSRWKISSPKA